MLKRLGFTLLALTLLVGGMVLGMGTTHAAVRHAAVTCSGTGCTGQFASATGCNVGDSKVQEVNISNRNGVIGSISLYYSSTCGTNWAHMHNTYSLPSSASVAYCIPNGSKQTLLSSAYAYDSPMIYSPTTPADAFGDIQSNGYYYSASTNCY